MLNINHLVMPSYTDIVRLDIVWTDIALATDSSRAKLMNAKPCAFAFTATPHDETDYDGCSRVRGEFVQIVAYKVS